MATVSDVRSELLLPDTVISDADIEYSIAKIGVDNIYLICAEVLRQVKRKYRGRVVMRVGQYSEKIDAKWLNSLIADYMAKAPTSYDDGNLDDGEELFAEKEFCR